MKFILIFLVIIFIISIGVNLQCYREILRLNAENEEIVKAVIKTKEELDIYKNKLQRYELQEEAAEIRELNFLKPVNYKTIAKKELIGVIQKKAEEELTGSRGSLEDFDKVLIKFGFLKTGESVMPYLARLYGEQVQGMYNEDTGEMILVAGLPLTGSLQRMFMVHELTHVLQDQHFNLKSLPLAGDNEDKALAALSLVEGDASLVMFFYYKAHFKIRQMLWDLFNYISVDQTEMYTTAYFIRENLLFPYKYGIKFVTYLYSIGGWETVDKTYRVLPQSTEQVLHPEKYPAEMPQEVIVKEELSDGWRELDRNTMGEFNIRVLCTIYLGAYNALGPSSGWGGDSWAVWENAERGELRAVWETVWDTAEDAYEFFDAYRELLRKRRVHGARIAKRGKNVRAEW